MNAFDNGDVRTTIIVFKPHQTDGARVQGKVINTILANMGTGGNNTPMVATIPIQDGRDINKEQNGLGVGDEGDPSYTLDRTGAQSVAIMPIQGTIIGRSDTAGPQGKGYGEDGDPMYTLDSVSGHGVAVVKAYDEFNDSLADTHHTLRSGTKQSTGVLITEEEDMATLMRMREGKPGGGKGPLISEDKSLTIATSNDQTLLNKGTVRRLTPVECERLQGFPDDWTAGQSDSSRYKQMGNAVAVPVVEWVIGNICDIV
jgi:DNA (cytosine-5)-methyltransferase 1